MAKTKRHLSSKFLRQREAQHLQKAGGVGAVWEALTVQGVGRDQDGNIALWCLCKCSNHCYARLYALQRGRQTTCGCRIDRAKRTAERIVKDAPLGTRFHSLTVTGVTVIKEGKHRRAMLECVCDCGGKCIARLTDLRHGSQRTCGCRNVKGWTIQNGYRFIWRPDHPNAIDKQGRIAEHRWVMSEYLGRPLTDNESVHHKAPNSKLDNRIENLELRRRYHGYGQVVEMPCFRCTKLEARIAELEAQLGSKVDPWFDGWNDNVLFGGDGTSTFKGMIGVQVPAYE